MWEQRNINTIEARGQQNQANEAKPPAQKTTHQAPSTQHGQPQAKRYESPGAPTETFVKSGGTEVWDWFRSINQTHISAVKTMTCIADVCRMCAKRGHTKGNCFTNPENPWYRPQGSKQAQQAPQKAGNAIISKPNSSRTELLVKQEGKE